MHDIWQSMKDYPGFWGLHTLSMLFLLWFVGEKIWRAQKNRSKQRDPEIVFLQQDLDKVISRLKTLEKQQPPSGVQDSRKSLGVPAQSTAGQSASRKPGQSTSPVFATSRQDELPIQGEYLPDTSRRLAGQGEQGSQFEGGRAEPAQLSTVPQASTPTLLYASGPEPDGSFKKTQLVRAPEYDSLFCLSVASNGREATLALFSNPDRFRTAVESPRRYLDPACSYRDAPQPGSGGIRQIRLGDAVLEDDRWRVVKRIEIQFY